MKKCPGEDTLRQLLDDSLTQEATSDVLSHLFLCSRCKDAVKGYLEEESGLLRSLTTGSLTLGPRKLSTQNCFSRNVLLAYLLESLTKEQEGIVEYHLNECDKCLRTLMQIRTAEAAAEGLELDVSAMFEEAKGSHAKESKLLTIVLRVYGDLLDAVTWSGNLLSPVPHAAAVRGGNQKPESSVTVRKDLQELDLSIELTVDRRFVENEGASVKVSVMRISSEEFVSGANIHFSGKEIRETLKTDSGGIVEFKGMQRGSTEIMVDATHIGTIVIE